MSIIKYGVEYGTTVLHGLRNRAMFGGTTHLSLPISIRSLPTLREACECDKNTMIALQEEKNDGLGVNE